MVTTRVDPRDAGRHGVVQVRDGRVADHALKPDEPQGDLVCNEVFVFDAVHALDVLERLADEADEDGLADLGDGLLPALVQEGGAREHRFEGYWRDVGTLEAYHASHMDLLGDAPAFQIDDPSWPLLTRGGAGRRPGCVAGPAGTTCCCPRARRSWATSSAPSCRRGSSSSRARSCATACCCTTWSYVPARGSSTPCWTAALRWPPISRWAAAATSCSSVAGSTSRNGSRREGGCRRTEVVLPAHPAT